VKGTLKLALEAPEEAKRLVVGIEARQRVVTASQQVVSYRRDTAWKFERELKAEGTFKTFKRRFTIKLPQDLERSGQTPPGPWGDLAQIVSFLSPTKRFPLEWAVFAYLDRPWKLNLKARVPITVSFAARERAAAPARSRAPARTRTPRKPRRPRGDPSTPSATAHRT
jgi:hypothetical protein